MRLKTVTPCRGIASNNVCLGLLFGRFDPAQQGELRSIRGDGSVPWLVMGDFNEILFNAEKEGGDQEHNGSSKLFNDALSDCELADMEYIGDLFTWHRGKIRERLDRAVANALWSSHYPQAALINSEMTRSDHRPILMDMSYLADRHEGGGQKKRFEARWLQEDTVEEKIKAAWARALARGEGPLLERR